MSFKPDTKCSCSMRQAVNFNERDPELRTDILLMHYTGMDSADAAIGWLCSEESGVSCHYVVDEEGGIFQLVPEAKRAWHAGKSCWQDETDTNSRSIGIEIVNPGHANGYPDFPEAQIRAVIRLSDDILKRHEIPAKNVLAHSDVAPGRKSDPGEKFPWRLLHENGIGHWVEPEKTGDGEILQSGDNGEPVAALQAMLALYGYGVGISGNFDKKTQDCVTAFQMHFRPQKIDGVADASTMATLEALVCKTS